MILAKLLRMEGLIGEISSGAYADVIVLERNPLEDIRVLDRHSTNLLAVVQGGYVFSSKIGSLKAETLR